MIFFHKQFFISQDVCNQCFSISDPEDCDQFIEENCDYFGKTVIKTPPGIITSPSRCQELCEYNQSDVITSCKYWLYDGIKRECTLLDSGEKICKGMSGQKHPIYDYCYDIKQ